MQPLPIDLPFWSLVQLSGWRLSQRSVIFLSSSTTHRHFPSSHKSLRSTLVPRDHHFLLSFLFIRLFFRNLVFEQYNFHYCLEHFPVLPFGPPDISPGVHHIQPTHTPSGHLIDLIETVISCIPGSESFGSPETLIQSL
jgi:hypothetical protein